jgi:hypothetical protein
VLKRRVLAAALSDVASAEVLTDPVVVEQMADTKAAKEMAYIEEFYRMLQTDPEKVGETEFSFPRSAGTKCNRSVWFCLACLKDTNRICCQVVIMCSLSVADANFYVTRCRASDDSTSGLLRDAGCRVCQLHSTCLLRI